VIKDILTDIEDNLLFKANIIHMKIIMIIVLFIQIISFKLQIKIKINNTFFKLKML
jgi:hypothetical protein